MENAQQSSKMQKRLFGMLAMLATEFVLGIIMTLFSNGFSGIWLLILILHILVGIGLLISSITILLSVTKQYQNQRNEAIAGAIAIWASFIAGSATVSTSSNVWSFIMALGFIAAMIIYGRLSHKIG